MCSCVESSTRIAHNLLVLSRIVVFFCFYPCVQVRTPAQFWVCYRHCYFLIFACRVALLLPSLVTLSVGSIPAFRRTHRIFFRSSLLHFRQVLLWAGCFTPIACQFFQTPSEIPAALHPCLRYTKGSSTDLTSLGSKDSTTLSAVPNLGLCSTRGCFQLYGPNCYRKFYQWVDSVHGLLYAVFWLTQSPKDSLWNKVKGTIRYVR